MEDTDKHEGQMSRSLAGGAVSTHNIYYSYTNCEYLYQFPFLLFYILYKLMAEKSFIASKANYFIHYIYMHQVDTPIMFNIMTTVSSCGEVVEAGQL